MKRIKLFIITAIASFCANNLSAQNPVIRDQFSADPTARVFNGKVYLFPSHDITAPEGKNLRKDWFCMKDYHVFSSENLIDWTDHGVIVSQNTVNWVDSTSYSMWAPDCIARNGKYYFYFPANTSVTDPSGRKGFGIGVAIADNPEGPYIPQEKPISGVHGIDPNVFIDKDGQAYLYWAMGKIFVAKLKENMLELDSEPQEVTELPEVGLKEGPFLFERNGIYYMTYPHVQNKIERLEYAISNSPMGPFKITGVIMDESPMNCWTNHQSVVEYRNQWYLFYHQNEYSPQFDKHRSVCIDSLFFNTDGTIQKVVPTRRGVGVTNAAGRIEIDRFSSKSEGTTIAFNQAADPFDGWKAVLAKKGDWVQYNTIDFGKGKFKKVMLNACAKMGGTIQLRLGNAHGPVIGSIQVPSGNELNKIEIKVSGIQPGIQNLVVVSETDTPVEVDWLTFK
jgi:hypothetical protein